VKFYQTEQEFLEGKRTIFGGSEVNTILGKSKFDTPHKLFVAKKNGTLKDSNKFMDAGKMLENSIIERFYKERNLVFVPDDKGILSFSHPTYDFIVVHPDNIFNEVCLLEVKTGQKYLTQDTAQEYLRELYFPQWNFTLGVMLENEPDTFSYHGYIVMFSRGIDYFECNFTFDKELYEECLKEVCAFKARLDEDNPPPLQDSDLPQYYKKSDGKTVDATIEDIETYRELIREVADLKSKEATVERLKAYFQRRLGNSERLVNPDTRRTLISWKSTAKSRTFKIYENNE
jgi:predicted phage-related endonuclease